MKAQCSIVGECQGGKVGVGGWGSTLIEGGGGGGVAPPLRPGAGYDLGVSGGRPGKGKTFKM